MKGSKISKPGKSFKVNLSHFKLKTVLGRGGYGKVGIKGVLQDEMSWFITLTGLPCGEDL